MDMLDVGERVQAQDTAVAEALARCTFASFCRDGAPIFIRPLRRSDRRLEEAFIASLSESTRFFRMLAPLRHLSVELLDRFMDVDGVRQAAIIATTRRQDGSEYMVGIARYALTDQPATAEIGVTVTDAWQRRGVATLLVEALIGLARERGIQRLMGLVLPENWRMLALAKRAGFHVSVSPGEGLMRIEKVL